MESRPNYTSFLVRLWSEQGSGREWVVQVESIPSGEKDYFTSLEALFAFIQRQIPSEGVRDDSAIGSA